MRIRLRDDHRAGTQTCAYPRGTFSWWPGVHAGLDRVRTFSSPVCDEAENPTLTNAFLSE